ncbi:GatB/YqeY domain-containing protein [Maritalea mobilis]|uniref:GatB/YqeY domain-containing protein n=1 Tax=Maritalea mobilis TaxID=483324 RepID=UPI001C97A413|nr:GatB/YqeY domain-containing protein [Maritalea mobilis]MBY6201079.1 GatB/YqeY domain-containing protein [Maritalea mobilis]
MSQTVNTGGNGGTLRERITTGLKDAMREKDQTRLSTLRLINAAIKDQDIAARAKGNADGVGEDDLLGILGKMVKQRQESARAYEEGGRLELAEKEREEIAVIETYLPRQLDEDEVAAAIDEAIAETEATSLRDMGKVMGVLKGKYTGQIDFGAVGPMVKERLS